MQLPDVSVLTAAQQFIEMNQPFWLCTIINTYGSAPRPIGSIFITDGEKRYGSISGGCLEDGFVKMLSENHFTKQNQLFTYGKHLQDEHIVRELPCGGTIELLIEYVLPTTENFAHFSQWLALVNAKQALHRSVKLSTQTRQVSDSTNQQRLSTTVEKTETTVTCHYQQILQLLIIGVGSVSEHVARLGIQSGYDVKVCDMRKDLANSWHLNDNDDGSPIYWASPDNFVEQYANANTAVLALAHDPRLDDVALMEAFNSDAFYIGAMGSIRTTQARIERLQRICQVSEQALTRLHAPIGLNIGSKTPMEIAIAIMADVLRCQRGIAKSEL
ncbi:XdhC family protein [Thalassotalea maritima]|uniref:XdhC family protein n=1 Tax=Thalassotalea maritima TaxID=3242416 RepID=UPI0035281B81